MKNPLSIEAFADWCEKQPPEKEYDYYNESECAAAQYARAMGLWEHYQTDNNAYGTAGGPYDELIQMANQVCAVDVNAIGTFGALTKHLREAQ